MNIAIETLKKKIETKSNVLELAEIIGDDEPLINRLKEEIETLNYSIKILNVSFACPRWAIQP